jgi:hypothetical protein
MEPSAELPVSFDCQATAAVLRSGSHAALAGHAAAILTLFPFSRGGAPAWIAFGSLLLWSAAVYLGIRVQIDARLFELLASQPAEQLDRFLEAAGFRKHVQPRTISQRRRGALRLWRALLCAVAAQVALLLLAIFYGFA